MNFDIKKWNPSIVNWKSITAFSLLNRELILYRDWKTVYKINENTTITIDWEVVVDSWTYIPNYARYRLINK